MAYNCGSMPSPTSLTPPCCTKVSAGWLSSSTRSIRLFFRSLTACSISGYDVQITRRHLFGVNQRILHEGLVHRAALHADALRGQLLGLGDRRDGGLRIRQHRAHARVVGVREIDVLLAFRRLGNRGDCDVDLSELQRVVEAVERVVLDLDLHAELFADLADQPDVEAVELEAAVVVLERARSRRPCRPSSCRSSGSGSHRSAGAGAGVGIAVASAFGGTAAGGAVHPASSAAIATTAMIGVRIEIRRFREGYSLT